MGTSHVPEPRTNDQLLSLIRQREESKEGTHTYIKLQQQIDKIIAENFLRYVNR